MTYSSGNSNQGAVQSSQYTNTGTQPGSGAEVLRTGDSAYASAPEAVTKYQRRDVTEQIQRYHQLYGGSDNTQQGGLAASKSLNYAPAPTMQRAQHARTTVFPFTYTLVGQVGLFGTENYYLRVDLDLLTPLNPEFEEAGWNPADITYGLEVEVNTYDPATLDYNLDPPPPSNTQELNDENRSIGYVTNPGEFPPIVAYNAYMAALITDPLPNFWDAVVSVELEDVGTGNIYIDNWLEPMLYTRDQQMWGYDKMYVRPKDVFYVGVHARNTRQLPYNIKLKIGYEYIQSSQVAERNLIATNSVIY